MPTRTPSYPSSHLQQPITPPIPYAWAAVTPDEERLYLEGLGVSALWVGERSSVDHTALPPCWRQHPELSEEITALLLAPNRPFSITAAHDTPLLWHERFARAAPTSATGVTRTG